MTQLAGRKVCFLAGTLGSGGAERQLYHFLQALCLSGARPRLLSFDRGKFWEEPIRRLGVPVACVGDTSSRLKRLLAFLRALHADPPDVVQSQHFFTNSYVAAAAHWLRVPGIGALRSNGCMEVRDCGRLGGWLNLHTPRLLATNSRVALDYARARGIPSRRLFLLPNVVDTTRLKPAGERPPGPIRLLAAGRLVPGKRFERFIFALARLRKRLGEDVCGTLAGDGPCRASLEKYAAAQGLRSQHLEFTGAVADLAGLYNRADIFVLTSDYEGTPNVLLEAMAAGLAVVATEVGGVPEIVRRDETGRLCAPDNPDALLDALLGLVQEANTRQALARSARNYVEANHSPELLPARLTELYQLASSGPRAQDELSTARR